MSDPRRVAVITGASRGLGAGLAEAFAARGMALGLCARTLPPVPDGATAVSRSLDVAEPGALASFATEVVDGLGPITLWINNAGVLAPIGPLAEADPDALGHLVAVNVTGVLWGSRVFARHVRSRPGEGVLVNITSGAATTPYEGWAAYSASKAAVDQATEVVALEEADHGLRAYAVAPGLVDTDMQALIRSTDRRDLPSVDRFRTAHTEGAMNTPSAVAEFIMDLVDDPAAAGAVRLRVPTPPVPGP
jgi:NAD(P)-dependent dehydrogenase (short-subunit alcohol dehydrogenase family)